MPTHGPMWLIQVVAETIIRGGAVAAQGCGENSSRAGPCKTAEKLIAKTIIAVMPTTINVIPCRVGIRSNGDLPFLNCNFFSIITFPSGMFVVWSACRKDRIDKLFNRTSLEQEGIHPGFCGSLLLCKIHR